MGWYTSAQYTLKAVNFLLSDIWKRVMLKQLANVSPSWLGIIILYVSVIPVSYVWPNFVTIEKAHNDIFQHNKSVTERYNC